MPTPVTRPPFLERHIGPDPDEQAAMLRALGVDSLETLIDQTVPPSIRLRQPLDLPAGESEAAYLTHLAELADQNRVYKNFIGMGYADCHTPSVILRTVFENPSWYTPYTPYQAEIAQGRLECLLNFQTMISDLTGLPIANASLLDEATAAAEAMTLLYRQSAGGRNAGQRNRLLVHETCYPYVLDVLQTRAEPLGIVVETGDVTNTDVPTDAFGVLIQNPDDHGAWRDWTDDIARLHEQGTLVAMGGDLLAMTLLRAPGEMGADVAYGSAQRFGVPPGFGGPHAAFFATREAFKRGLPGRIVGVSKDRRGQIGYRLALQAREQHIRREKATSNICTAQALLANIAALYAIHHGPEGLHAMARELFRKCGVLAQRLDERGVRPLHPFYFDTLHVQAPMDRNRFQVAADEARMNFRHYADGSIGIALGETTTEADLDTIVQIFQCALSTPPHRPDTPHERRFPEAYQRQTPYLQHPVFHAHRSETELMRYIKQLERKDIGLDVSMIPLGSCTMKCNAAAEMIPVSWPAFSRLHPFAPAAQTEGYRRMLEALSAYIAAMTGLPAVSLQPNSGAQGEYAGLLAIQRWHQAQGHAERNVALIPASAHGTNPASASLAGLEVVMVKCNERGQIDPDDCLRKAQAYRDRLAVLMITYPSTYGVFEEGVREWCDAVHALGGQVYMDGANLNAQVGLTSPALIGADVCHLNLHKTFAIPHGGGGPGMGPIAVAAHLAPYLPGHRVVPIGKDKLDQCAVSAAPYGSASILLISYGYVRLLGATGVCEATRLAILNANYIKQRLEPYYPVPFSGTHGRVAHELIFDLRPFKTSADITETDVAKRLMDYGFHAPTVSWPVPGTLMVEPTESENKDELDRFCDAMIAIHDEIQAIATGQADREDNVLKNAPHTMEEVIATEWTHPYPREQAAFPLPFVRTRKCWPTTARIDQAYGDRVLVCNCPPLMEA